MANKKVLFVDSDKEFIERWGNILKNNGIEVHSSSEGAPSIVLSRTHKPSLIILGVELRDMNGYLVCKKLREDEQVKTIPVFITSTTSTEKDFDRHKKLRVRADEYFHKPVEDNNFIKKLSEVLGIEISADVQFAEKKERVIRVDDAELRSLENQIKSMNVEMDLLRKDLEDARASRAELAKSLGVELENEKEKVKSLEGELRSLTERLSAAELEKESLTERISKMDRERSNAEKEYSKKLTGMEKELSKYEMNIKNSQEENTKLREEIAAYRNEVVRLKDRNVSLTELVHEKDEELSHLQSQMERIKELENSIALLGEEKNRLSDELNAVKTESRNEINSLEEELKRATDIRDEHLKDLEDYKKRTDYLETLLVEKDMKINTLTDESNRLAEELEKIKTEGKNEMVSLMDEIKRSADERERFIKEIETHKNRVKELEATLEENDSRASRYEERIKSLESRIAQKEEELLSLKGIQERVSELEQEQSMLLSQNSEMRERIRELEELTQKDVDLLNTLEQVVKEKEALLKRVNELEGMQLSAPESSELSKLEEEISSLHSLIRTKDEELKNLRELVDVQMEEKSALNRELDEYKSRLSSEQSVPVTEEPPLQDAQLLEEQREEAAAPLEEAQLLEPETPSVSNSNDLEKMIDNIWEDSKKGENGIEATSAEEDFFGGEELEEPQIFEETIPETDETREWRRIIKGYNEIYRMVFENLSRKGVQINPDAIWEEFINEKESPDKGLFDGIHIEKEGTLPVAGIVKKLVEMGERERMGKIAGLENLFINQKLKIELNELLDFFIIFIKKNLPPEQSNALTKTIKTRQKSIA